MGGKGIKNEKDLAILQTQLKNGVGLFACNDWEVFSDKQVQLSSTITARVLPENLRSLLASKMDTTTGVYFQNCKGVLEGFFGNLEVSSAEGFKRFLEQFEKAYSGGCWKQETEACKAGWKYGAWGEDLFMQRTMDDAEVAKIDDFELTTSGTCPGDRPAGQKTNKQYA